MSVRSLMRLAGAFAALAAASDVRADPVTVVERPGHTTEATVTVDAPPHEVYQLVTDYPRWTQVLGDVASVTLRSGGRDHATVHFRSRALQHEVTVVFDNAPDRRISFRGIEGPPGGRASGSYALEPVDHGTRTRVTARLYLDVVGPASLFVRGSTIRAMRERKLRADLGDVARHFAQAPRSGT